MIAIPKHYYHAAYFIRSMKLTHADVRILPRDEIDYIVNRGIELEIYNVKDYVKFIKNNRNIERFEKCWFKEIEDDTK